MGCARRGGRACLTQNRAEARGKRIRHRGGDLRPDVFGGGISSCQRGLASAGAQPVRRRLRLLGPRADRGHPPRPGRSPEALAVRGQSHPVDGRARPGEQPRHAAPRAPPRHTPGGQSGRAAGLSRRLAGPGRRIRVERVRAASLSPALLAVVAAALWPPGEPRAATASRSPGRRSPRAQSGDRRLCGGGQAVRERRPGDARADGARDLLAGGARRLALARSGSRRRGRPGLLAARRLRSRGARGRLAGG